MSGEIQRSGAYVDAHVVGEAELKLMQAKARIFPMLDEGQAERVGEVLDDIFAPKPPGHSNESLVRMFLEAKRIEGLSPKTLRYYLNSIRDFSAICPKAFTEVDADDVRGYLRMKLDTTCGAVSADNIRRNLSSFFMWMETEDIIAKSPMRKVKPIKSKKIVKKPFDDMEIERIRDACADERDHLIVEFLISSGVRANELATLRTRDVDMPSRRAVVTGKGNKEREVHFSSSALMWMGKYLAMREGREGDDMKFLLVSSSRRGGAYMPISRGSLEAIVRKIGQRAGVENCHPHRFRRTMATNSLKRGMSIDQVKELLGHESISTTTIYAITDHEQTMDAARRLIG